MLKKLRPEHAELAEKLIPPSKFKDFKETYLTGLKSWHAFGLFDSYKEDELKAISCGFYSGEYPEWYYIGHYCDDADDLHVLINETCLRFEKFELKRFCWVARNYEMDYLLNYLPERYATFMDYKLAGWRRSPFIRHYSTLYGGQWSPVDSEVYTSILKTGYRKP